VLIDIHLSQTLFKLPHLHRAAALQAWGRQLLAAGVSRLLSSADRHPPFTDTIHTAALAPCCCPAGMGPAIARCWSKPITEQC
jgi:hypothetical protein